MSSETSITVEGVAKAYRIYPAPSARLWQAVVPRLRRLAAPLLRAARRPVEAAPFFTEHWALRELSFSVQRGETVGVIGRNGSGKSTLLQLICGTLTPSLGRVELRGRVAALLELGSGFNPEYTGRENVFLNASVLGLTREETVERLDRILAFADIGDAVDQPVKTYSSGMAMRLAFAVIAHVDADVLIIDEALAVGDAYFQQKCLRWLRGFQESGTILFCSHDTGAVMNFCERAIWLDAGNVRMMGPAKEVCEAYSAFINTATQTLPAMRERKAPGEGAASAAPPRRVLPAPPPQDKPVVFDWLGESSSFGSGDAEFSSVRLTTPDGVEPSWITGGEALQVRATLRVHQDVADPIFGFHVKDRLGQPIIGDNTLSIGTPVPRVLRAGQSVTVRFSLNLPLLATGRYSITCAMASGTLENHVQHHWVHDALFFDVHSPFRNGVLLAIDGSEAEVMLEEPGDATA
ncbi:ABC transporter ATP-binding protein [Roseococcus suduntuyensis]|uniref:Lipopolysaccharide transport system ATP-binding protein n=1 Tax=Roseococcus suduntuyensis TaxID=455361 RepID=A0A840AJE0_9PROT|nr:ABC transporter ATP-binding protein [Roseococcus suduntuyensis]MBB3900234.1 lipopolysaccharide transport system ATP-binding protein [Roseococcus suduntuyensis]